MKKFSTLIFFASILTLSLSAQSPVPASEASKHYGETVTICEKVYGGKFMEHSKSKVTLLNLGGAYPNHKVTINISNESRKNFKERPEEAYTNRNVCVTGKIVEFNGKPEIVINKPEEIEIQSENGVFLEIKPNDFFKFQ